MRVTGGEFRGRPLASPKSDAIRPTSDRVREALFNIIANNPDVPPLEGAHIIDLFAGTGALGFEALSRGAAHCIFVDQSTDARGLIRTNIETLKLEGQTRLMRRDATKLGPALDRDRVEIAFLDPPYDKGLGERALHALQDGDWLNPGALIILEERSKNQIALPAGFHALDTRKYGEAAVHLLRFEPGKPS
ncbi:MAG: 16S rRNA (guanine(966)-N(2))-methyltransferase RsmD [Pseudomonadota bacterium]